MPHIEADVEERQSSNWSDIDGEQEIWGMEALAWYKPYHLKPLEKWGIYISEIGLLRVLDHFLTHNSNQTPLCILPNCSYLLFHRHEFFHFLTEFCATFQEITSCRPLYLNYLRMRNRRKNPLTHCHSSLRNLNFFELEEAFSNVYVISSRCP
ncbi:MAG: hypothetical protein QXP04_01850 [Candidatus Nanoarchaeia archaeon]|nr:hypothetical protein [Candidatus Jingweiarchaeum tengchongense]